MSEQNLKNLNEAVNDLHLSSKRLAMDLTCYKNSPNQPNVFSYDFMEGHYEDVQDYLGPENCLSLEEIFLELTNKEIISVIGEFDSVQNLDKYSHNLLFNSDFIDILEEEFKNLN